jgi:hypothetical protein
MDALTETAQRLSALSRRHYRSAYAAVDWPETVQQRQWFTSPDLISIYGTPHWESLSDPQRMGLSFWEAVNFFSINIHGEKTLLEGLAHRLYQPGLEDVTEYLHHFLDEENKHSVWFGTFCTRYAGRVYPDRKVAFPTTFGPTEEEFLFFARVVIFEEIVDRYNAAMATDERLVAVARQINALHHADETRHLVFGRQLLAQLWHQRRPHWTTETVTAVRRYLANYLAGTWREYYNPSIYLDAGLADPWVVAREAWDHPATREHRQRLSRRCVGFLVDSEILDETPTL